MVVIVIIITTTQLLFYGKATTIILWFKHETSVQHNNLLYQKDIFTFYDQKFVKLNVCWFQMNKQIF